MKILFVCHGNICRSPIAEVVFRELVREEGLDGEVLIDSAGTSGYHDGELADQRALTAARQHRLGMPHRSRKVIAADLSEFDRIVAMDSENLRDLKQLASTDQQRRKIVLMRDYDPSGPGDVPDPYFGSQGDFDMVWHLCERSSPRLLADLRKNEK